MSRSRSGLRLHRDNPSPRKHSRHTTARAEAARRHRRLFLEPLEGRVVLNADTGLPASPDSYTLTEDTPLTISAPGILANDSGTSAILIGDGPQHGSLTFGGDGSFSYTPDANYFGPDSFLYQAIDGVNASGYIEVSLTVEPVNDLPVTTDISFSVDEDTPLDEPGGMLVGVTDPDDDETTLTPVITTPPAFGIIVIGTGGSFIYTPAPGFVGTVGFGFIINDPIGSSNPGTGTITVEPVNDPPVAVDHEYATSEDTPLLVGSYNGLLNGASDPDNDVNSLTPSIVGEPANGTLQISTQGSFLYTPNHNFNGTDSFTFQLSDGTALSNVATVTITVGPVNDPPVAVNDNFTLDEDALYFTGDLLPNDYDIDSPTLTTSLYQGVSHGYLIINADGTFNYTPTTNFSGTDWFTYYVSDASASSWATVNLTVTEINDAPIAADDSYTVAEDTPLSVSASGVLGNDTDIETGAVLTATLISGPVTGSLNFNTDGSFTFTPAPNFHGTETFTYNATDPGSLTSNTATVTIVVSPVNDPPTAADHSYQLDEDTVLTVSDTEGLLSGAIDPDDDNLTLFTIIDPPTHGTVSTNSDGSFTYTPVANYFGPDSFFYAISDGALYATGTVTLTVHPVADPTPAVTVIGSSVEEGENVIFYFQLSGHSDADVTVEFATFDLTADAATDYESEAGFVVIPVGSTTSVAVVVGTTADNEPEDYETFAMSITNVLNASIDVPTAEGEIRNDDYSLPWVSVTANIPSIAEENGQSNVEFTFTRTNDDGDLTVYFSMQGGATLATDYQLSTAGSVVIPNGSLSAIVTLVPVDDALSEGADSAILVLDGGGYFIAGDGMYAEIAIEDDEASPLPMITVESASGVEGTGAESNSVNFTVSIDVASADDIVINFETADKNALAGVDYTATSGQVTVAAGLTSATVSVPLIADGTNEPDEEFTLLLTAATNATLAENTSAIGIIENDDAPVSYSLTITSQPTEEDEGYIYVLVEISPEVNVGGEVVVHFSTADLATPPSGYDSAIAGDDYESQAIDITFEHGLSYYVVEIAVADDMLGESDEALELSANITSGAPSASANEIGVIQDPNLPPEFTNENFASFFDDDVPTGTEVFDLEGMDPDSDSYEFFLDEENPRYEINSLTGVISLAESVTLLTEYLVDALPVRITDSKGASSYQTVFVSFASDELIIIVPEVKIQKQQLSFRGITEVDERQRRLVAAFSGRWKLAFPTAVFEKLTFATRPRPIAGERESGQSNVAFLRSEFKASIQTEEVNGKTQKTIDFSGTKILVIPHSIIYSDESVRQNGEYTYKGKVFYLDYPRGTDEHENWHVGGHISLSNGFKNNGVDPKLGFPGYAAGAEHAQARYETLLKEGLVDELKSATEAEAKDILKDATEAKLTGEAAGWAILEFGLYHAGFRPNKVDYFGSPLVDKKAAYDDATD